MKREAWEEEGGADPSLLTGASGRSVKRHVGRTWVGPSPVGSVTQLEKLQTRCGQQPGEVCVLWPGFLANSAFKRSVEGTGGNRESFKPDGAE